MAETARPEPNLEAAVSRLLMAAEKFSAAAEELPAPVLKKAAAGWSPKRVERLAEQLARALVSAEELAGVLEAAHVRRVVAAAAYDRWRRGQGSPRARPAGGDWAAAEGGEVESPRSDDCHNRQDLNT